MRGSIIIILFFIVGILIGSSDFFIEINSNSLSFYALCTLMFLVGMSIGGDSKILKSFKSLNPKLILLPLITIIGTLVGSALVSFILSGRSLTDCLAVGSGFGYYSLSSIFITEIGRASCRERV